MTAALAAWLVEMGLVTWRQYRAAGSNAAGLPLPADYLAVTALFALFGLPPRGSEVGKVTGALAWAYVLATYMNIVDPSTIAGAVGFTGGKAGNAPAGSGQQPQSVNAAGDRLGTSAPSSNPQTPIGGGRYRT
jgi:hypothetical protein